MAKSTQKAKKALGIRAGKKPNSQKKKSANTFKPLALRDANVARQRGKNVAEARQETMAENGKNKRRTKEATTAGCRMHH